MNSPFPRGIPTDLEILILWRRGLNTYDIARKHWVPEWHIAGRLHRILERARQDNEWSKSA